MIKPKTIGGRRKEYKGSLPIGNREGPALRWSAMTETTTNDRKSRYWGGVGKERH